ncbi:MAG: DUF1993 domain-containing protein [Paracoccaceae bacterium]
MQSPVPYFAHSLTALSAILDKAIAFEQAKRLKPDVIPNLRLIADMFPFSRQVQTACDHAKGAVARLTGAGVPSFADTETTLPELKDRIARTLAFIGTVPESAFDGASARTIHVKAGPRELSFPAPQYLYGYAIPNFYFHMTTAYNLLRANGVEVGKVDFLGG